MKKHKKRFAKEKVFIGFVVFLLTLSLLIFQYSGASECTCTKLSSTSIDVTDPPSVGTAIALYLSKTFTMEKTGIENKCNQELYFADFSTKEVMSQRLYVAGNGDIYSC